jgi:hypothetical protein
MATTGLNTRAEIIERVDPYLASGAVTAGYVAIPDGFDANGHLLAKISNSAGLVRPLGIFEFTQSTGKPVGVKSKGLIKGVAGGAIDENVEVSYGNTGKLKAAASGEIVVGTSRSKTTADLDEILVEWNDSYYTKP